MSLVMGFELSQGNETLHHPNKLYIHHGPFRVVFFAGWIVMGTVLLKLCVVWVSLLHNLHKPCDAWLSAVAMVEEGVFLQLHGSEEVPGLVVADTIPACCLLGLCFEILNAELGRRA